VTTEELAARREAALRVACERARRGPLAAHDPGEQPLWICAVGRQVYSFRTGWTNFGEPPLGGGPATSGPVYVGEIVCQHEDERLTRVSVVIDDPRAGPSLIPLPWTLCGPDLRAQLPTGEALIFPAPRPPDA
jgi:hypothetical protein